MSAHGVDRRARASIGSRVVVGGLLALAVVVLVNWLAGRPGIRLRVDLTSAGTASLDPATERVLAALPGPVTVDVFFRPEAPPLDQVAAAVQGRTLDLLELMRLDAGERFEVTAHDLTNTAAVRERLQELRINGLENCLVVSAPVEGEEVPARHVVPLFGARACASVDLGNPDPNAWRPATVQSFDAERSLLAAVLKVTQGRRPALYFSWGHGEGDPFETDGDPEGFGRLETLLREDGFVTKRWNGAEDGAVPSDCTVLALLEPETPLSEDERASVDAFLARGGRLVIAPHADPGLLAASGIRDLCESLGIEVTDGLVCEPKRDPATTAPVVGGPQVAFVQALPTDMAPHPITGPYRDVGQPLWVPTSHGLRVARQPRLGLAQGIVRSPVRPPGSWLDEPPFDWTPDDLEDRQQRDLVVAWSQALENSEGPIPDDWVGERRAVVLGSGGLLQDAVLRDPRLGPFNESFARNAFNWVADREYRVSVAPRDPRMERVDGEAAVFVVQVALWGLPLLSLALAAVTAVLRRRGAPSQGGSDA